MRVAKKWKKFRGVSKHASAKHARINAKRGLTR